MARVRVGISGWRYAPWRGAFYPEGLPIRRELEYATRLLDAVEVNRTFYALASPRTYERWREDSAPGAVLALKGSRYITHRLRLRDVEIPLANFFASGVLRLEHKLGPILWQLPPRMQWDPDAFERFCQSLPHDMHAAALMARHHDRRVLGKTSFAVDRNRRIRYAFELRDPRMFNEACIRSLRRHRHALVFTDTAGRYPYAEDITAAFVYVRLHGAEELYTSGYHPTALARWQRRIASWHRGEEVEGAPRVTALAPPSRRPRDVYVFFDNDALAHAPFDALALRRLLGLTTEQDAARRVG